MAQITGVGFAALHYKSAARDMIDLAGQSTIPILRPP